MDTVFIPVHTNAMTLGTNAPKNCRHKRQLGHYLGPYLLPAFQVLFSRHNIVAKLFLNWCPSSPFVRQFLHL